MKVKIIRIGGVVFLLALAFCFLISKQPTVSEESAGEEELSLAEITYEGKKVREITLSLTGDLSEPKRFTEPEELNTLLLGIKNYMLNELGTVSQEAAEPMAEMWIFLEENEQIHVTVSRIEAAGGYILDPMGGSREYMEDNGIVRIKTGDTERTAQIRKGELWAFYNMAIAMYTGQEMPVAV